MITKKEAIQKIVSILASFGLPVTPELLRQSSIASANERIHELLIQTIHALLIIDSNSLWLYPSLKKKIQKLIQSEIPISERLRYIRIALQRLGFTIHLFSLHSNSRQKLLCLSWLILRIQVIPWYIKRMESLHSDKVRIPFYPSDLEATEIKSENNLLNDEDFDFSDLEMDELSKVITAFVRKIQLKSRFFEAHFKALTNLYDEIQKKTHFGENSLNQKLSPYDLLLTSLKENEEELENHFQTLKFLTDIYESCRIYFEWIESIAVSEKLQGSGVVNTLDIDCNTLNRQIRKFSMDYFSNLIKSVKEIHEGILIEFESQERSNEEEESQSKVRQNKWWGQVFLYERKTREIEMTKFYKDESLSVSENNQHHPFILDSHYEHENITLEQRKDVPSGVALEIKRLQSILEQISKRLINLRSKHENYLQSIIKSSMYEPIA